MKEASRHPPLVVDSSALSILIAWGYLRTSPNLPRQMRREILADTHGGMLPSDDAFERLWAIFVTPQRRIVTANVLQELWKARLPAKLRINEERFLRMANGFQQDFPFEEEVVTFRDLWADPDTRPWVVRLGVTDVALVRLGQTHAGRLATEDSELRNYARASGLEVCGTGGW